MSLLTISASSNAMFSSLSVIFRICTVVLQVPALKNEQDLTFPVVYKMPFPRMLLGNVLLEYYRI